MKIEVGIRGIAQANHVILSLTKKNELVATQADVNSIDESDSITVPVVERCLCDNTDSADGLYKAILTAAYGAARHDFRTNRDDRIRPKSHVEYPVKLLTPKSMTQELHASQRQEPLLLHFPQLPHPFNQPPRPRLPKRKRIIAPQCHPFRAKQFDEKS